MAPDHRRLFLLLKLAAQNVDRRPVRSLFLGLAVMISVGVGLSAFVIGWALREGVATTFARMGADIVIVPHGALINITSILLTVQPTDQELEAALGEKIRAIPGVGRAAEQRMVRAQSEGRSFNLIAYDPLTDFTVRPWLQESQNLTAEDGLILGERAALKPGEVLNICGRSLPLTARLGKTGVGPFDESYFISFSGLNALVAARGRLPRAGGLVPPAPAECLPDLAPGRVSAFLIELAPGASPEQVKFALGQISGIKVVTGNATFTASRQALGGLFWGVGAVAGLLYLALLFLVCLLFSAIVQERYREVGLLKAMGARPAQIMYVILIEAGLITGLGGVFGLGFGFSLILLFVRSFGVSFASSGISFAWPADSSLAAAGLASLACAILIGVGGAFVPAWRARNMEPYLMIQRESAR